MCVCVYVYVCVRICGCVYKTVRPKDRRDQTHGCTQRSAADFGGIIVERNTIHFQQEAVNIKCVHASGVYICVRVCMCVLVCVCVYLMASFE